MPMSTSSTTVGEVVGGRAVGPHQDEVVDRIGGEDHLAADGVVEDDLAAVLGNREAPHVRLAGGDASGGLVGRQFRGRCGRSRRSRRGLARRSRFASSFSALQKHGYA